MNNRTTFCLKCGEQIRYVLNARRNDGGIDKLIHCKQCGYNYTVMDKVNETLDRNRPEMVGGVIWL